jgi:purine nucleosidase
MKFIIDTDMGIDDAMALLMVLAQPQAELLAITSVVGNISLAQATHNVGVMLNVAAAPPIPIYRGCAKPLLQYQPEHAEGIHGPDGLGGASRPTTRPIEAEHAALTLIRLARRHPGELTLLTLGPLTNVALAVRLDPDFPKLLHRLVMMGGAVDGRGNTTAPAEFNVLVDPEAAKIVFGACCQVPGGVWLLPWETSLARVTPFAQWDELLEGDSPKAAFARQMTVFIKQVMTALNFPALFWPDPLAAAVALAPEIVTAQEARFVDVEIGSGPARGQTVVDYRLNTAAPPNMFIVRDVNMPAFLALVRQAVQ